MNAFQPSSPPLQPVKPRQVTPKVRRSRQRHPHRAMALETTGKLFANIVLSAAAVYALVQLLPYIWSQQEKLREIQTENQVVEGRVNRLQTDFSRYFDPQEAKTIMQEQSNRLAPGQHPVVLLKAATTEAKAPKGQ